MIRFFLLLAVLTSSVCLMGQCPSNATMTADVNEICEDGTMSLEITTTSTSVISGDYEVTVNGPGGPYLGSISEANGTMVINVSSAGDYSFAVKDNGENCDALTVGEETLVVNASPVVSGFTASQTEYCEGTTSLPIITVSFSGGQPPYTFGYSSGSGSNISVMVSPASTASFVVNNPVGDYTQKTYSVWSLTDVNNCYGVSLGGSIDIVQLEKPTQAVITIKSNKYFVKEGEEVILTATVQNTIPNLISWFNLNTNTIFEETVENELALVIVEDIALHASIENNTICGGKVISNEVNIQIQDLKVEVLANQDEAVVGEELTLTATVTGEEGDLTYEWISQSSGQRIKKTGFPDAAEITFTQTAIDDYYVKVTDQETGAIIKSDWVFSGLAVAGVNASTHFQENLIYPTSVTDKFTVNHTGVYEMAIYSLEGVLMQKQQLTNKSEVLLNDFENGVYLVKVTQGNHSSNTKIIVSR